MSTTEILTYDDLNREARPFPSYLLSSHSTALALFAAGFHGVNDCIHFARRNMACSCVDINADRLWEMATIYPEGWAYYAEDAWEFAERMAADGRQWDVVTVDCFFDDATEKVWDSLELWLSLTCEALLITARPYTELDVPEGWSSFYYPRGDMVGWLVLQRD